MGDRGQILIEDTKVYLYTHWGATGLEDTLKEALRKKLRWDDVEYLTRIIFCEMVKGYESDEAGFGIGIQEHGDVWKVIKVNCKNQTISTNEEVKSFEEFIK